MLYPQLERFREFNSAELGVRNWFFSSGQLSEISRVYPGEEEREGGITGEKGVTEKDGPARKKKGKRKMNFVFGIAETSYSFLATSFGNDFQNWKNTAANSVYDEPRCLASFLSLTKIL